MDTLPELVKRTADFGCAALALVLVSPVMIFAAALIALRMGRPVVFVQQRPGRNGECFALFKFRSMTGTTTRAGEVLPDEQRLTSLGKFLRSTSIDELPSLFNVLRGDMSLVGPRPLLVEYLPLYNQEQAARHDVRPGITGWAQVNGRNALSWEEKFAHDIWYVRNRSLALDLKILALTVLKVIRRDGISAEGQATMSRFEGSGGSDRTAVGRDNGV